MKREKGIFLKTDLLFIHTACRKEKDRCTIESQAPSKVMTANRHACLGARIEPGGECPREARFVAGGYQVSGRVVFSGRIAYMTPCKQIPC